jgi:GDP-mannose 6-dehydrogenase
LIGKGFELLIYDRNVKLASLVGANRDYILNHISRTSGVCSWMTPVPTLFAASDVVVIATAEKEFASLVARHGPGKIIIDLVGTGDISNPATLHALKSYDGIAW